MKKLSKVLVIVMLMFMVGYVANAQDATAEPGDVVIVDETTPPEVITVTDSPFETWVIVGLIALVAVGIGFWAHMQGKTLDKAADSIPLPIVEMLFDLAYSRTALTEESFDEEALIRLATSLGFEVVATGTGYDLKRTSVN